MDIVKVVAFIIVVAVLIFGGVLLVYSSRLEKEILAEINGQQVGPQAEEEDHEI